MSGCAAVLNAIGGYAPRHTLTVLISHSSPVGNPDGLISFAVNPDFMYGAARKQEGFTTTPLFPRWAGLEFGAAAGANAGAQFQGRLTVNSGSAPNLSGGSATGVWLSLAGGLFWGYERNVAGLISGSWTFEIRSAASLQVAGSFGILPELFRT